MESQPWMSVTGSSYCFPHHPLGGVWRFYQLRKLLVELDELYVSLLPQLFISEGKRGETYLE